MFIFKRVKKHNFTYFLYGLFDTQNFGQEIKGRFLFKPRGDDGNVILTVFLRGRIIFGVCSCFESYENLPAD